mgnify:CR=1 FL=1
MEFDKEAESILILQALSGKYTPDVLSLVNQDDFHDNTNNALFSLIGQMFNNNEPLSLLSVSNKAKDLFHDFMRKNSFASLSDISLSIVKSDIPLLAKRLKNATQNRQLMDMVRHAADDVKAEKNPADTAADAQDRLIKMGQDSERSLISPKDLSLICAKSTEERMDEKTRNKQVIYTAFKSFNNLTGGFEKGDLVILSGSTGGGKSALAMNFAAQIGVVQKRPTLYINTEIKFMP